MKATTVKVSPATRDRIRSLGGTTFEQTIVEALDALEAQRFWAEAEAAAAWRSSLDESHRERLAARDRALDDAFEGTE